MRGYLEQFSSKDNNKRRQFIIDTLTKLNCPYFIQREKLGQTWVENIIIKMKRSCPKLIIGAHYDSFQESVGSNDNGSGVVVLLKFLEDYISEFPNIPDVSIEFVFFDCEEIGLLGSKAYLNRVLESDILAMINLDTVGVGDTILLAPKESLKDNMLGQAVNVVNSLGKYNIQILDQLPPSDEQSFIAKKIPSISAFTMDKNEVDCMIEAVNNQTQDLTKYPSVIDTIHNGPRDSINSIEYEAMEMALEWLKDLVKNFKV